MKFKIIFSLRHLNFREEHITEVDNFDEFKSVLSSKGGFLSAHWDGTTETEEAIKKQTKATKKGVYLLLKFKVRGNAFIQENPPSKGFYLQKHTSGLIYFRLIQLFY